MPHPMRHAHALQRLHHPRLPIRSRHLLAVGEREFDILVNRQIANQVETLEDKTDFPVPDARALSEIEVLDRLPIQRLAPTGRGVQQSDDRQQR